MRAGFQELCAKPLARSALIEKLKTQRGLSRATAYRWLDRALALQWLRPVPDTDQVELAQRSAPAPAQQTLTLA